MWTFKSVTLSVVTAYAYYINVQNIVHNCLIIGLKYKIKTNLNPRGPVFTSILYVTNDSPNRTFSFSFSVQRHKLSLSGIHMYTIWLQHHHDNEIKTLISFVQVLTTFLSSYVCCQIYSNNFVSEYNISHLCQGSYKNTY